MREIFEDALVAYRQEAENLVVLVAPALTAGPILVLVAAVGVTEALITIPLFVLLYVLTYAACVRAAGLVLANLAPDALQSYLDVIQSLPGVLRASAPGALLLAGIAWSGVIIGDQGDPALALPVALGGALVFLVWAARHAYDQPLLLVQELSPEDAARAGTQITSSGLNWTLYLLLVSSLPLIAIGLLSGLVAVWIEPRFGAILFTLAVAVWLPLPAFTITNATDRVVAAA